MPSKPRTAVITGAAQGIGRFWALRLASDGMTVVAADVRPCDETVAQVTAAGGRAVAVLCDVTDEASVKDLQDEVDEQFGGADVLVNNAIAYAQGSLMELTLADWRRVVSVGVDGLFLTSRALVPSMKRRGWGRVINVASNTFDLMLPGLVPYVTAKGAVIGFTRALASELGPYGITVNCIAPGLTRTEQSWEALAETGLFDRMATMQAIPRTEVPEDLVGTLSFLASDDAAFVTGQTIVVDGGLVRH
ncbi:MULTISPECIES: SDR family NAD(P)-dependent oxidoreductase [Streptomyces]|uniref:SDR family NAD(P)-dependent oxidoreductase n=1 Tax=Streptomyces lycopersici TaxID=2974589 RepID=UPI0021D32CF3|nr:SDR family oxidoreductase [Streptomyces sp. NEAU-383]